MTEPAPDHQTPVERAQERLRAADAHIAALNAELAETNRGLLALHAELEQATRVAQDANRAKSEFISRMSHELRTPLNAVLGFAQLLEYGDLDAAERDSVQHILAGGRHLLELISEVLDIARIEAGRLPLSPEPVMVQEVVREVIGLMRPIASARDVRCDAGAVLMREDLVHADRQRFKQILLNLTSNAIKYNRQGGRVVFSCSEDPDGSVQVSVADTGLGLTAAQLELAFEPFERVGADATETEGSGVGLALARRLAEAMGGRLEAESEPGSGSSFHVLLPPARGMIRSDAGPGQAPPEDGGISRGGASRKIGVLYIEDNRVNQLLVQRIFQLRPEVDLRLASSADEGFDSAQREPPDLILLDMHLPDESGDQTLARLRGATATESTPVVMLSADASPGQIERLLAAGAFSYLTKPFEIDKLLETVDAALAALDGQLSA